MGEKTRLTVNDIIELLDFVLTATYFQFDNTHYRQRFGAAVG